MSYETLDVSLDHGIARITLNRPAKANSLSRAAWEEIRAAFTWVDATPEARVAVLAGNGTHFCAGIDLGMLASLREAIGDDCEGRSREKLRRLILDMQDTLTSLERCRKPVLAAVHGACVGAGVDLVCCADMRYSTADATFQVKEIDLGMTADVGTLQRLPRLVADGVARELAYTGRPFAGAEAAAIGFVNRAFDSREAMSTAVDGIANAIAARAPLAMRGVKEMLVYARDHTVADGLNYVATWNAAMLLSTDLAEAMTAGMERRAPQFRD